LESLLLERKYLLGYCRRWRTRWRGDLGLARRQGGPAQGRWLAGHGGRAANRTRHPVPHRLDDQADHLDSGAYAVRGGPVCASGPDCALEFSQMRVLRSPTGPLDQTDPAQRPITFEDLLTHRSGLTYGPFWSGPIAQAYDEALGGDIDSDVAPDDWIAGLAALPLIDQPGAALHYSHSTDLLGLLIARMEDAALGDVLQRRIFGPLGMKDTGFIVPAAKRDRRAGLYGFDAAGRLSARLTCPGGSTVPERPADMAYVSGGQGLWSTLDDYLAFARMFLGAGTVDGVRLLQPATLALMTTNQLTARQRAASEVGGMPLFAAGHGFGMGVAVVLEPAQGDADNLRWQRRYGRLAGRLWWLVASRSQ